MGPVPGPLPVPNAHHFLSRARARTRGSTRPEGTHHPLSAMSVVGGLVAGRRLLVRGWVEGIFDYRAG